MGSNYCTIKYPINTKYSWDIDSKLNDENCLIAQVPNKTNIM